MKSYDEFIKLSDEELISLLNKQKIFIPKKMPKLQLIDYAKSKLHGIEFINNDEKQEKGKIVKIIVIPKAKPGTECPNCKQKTLRKLNVLDSSQYSGFVHCSYCGLYLSPNEQKDLKQPTGVKA